MKLALAAVAALSLVGCATENDGEGGAYQDGLLRPAKPSLDETPFGALNEDVANFLLNGGLTNRGLKGIGDRAGADASISVDEVSVPFPIDGLCKICDKGVIAVVDNRFPDELNLVDKFGKFFCTLWVDETGRIVSDNCR